MTPESNKRKEGEDKPATIKKLFVQPHTILNRGPYLYSQPKKSVLLFSHIELLNCLGLSSAVL